VPVVSFAALVVVPHQPLAIPHVHRPVLQPMGSQTAPPGGRGSLIPEASPPGPPAPQTRRSGRHGGYRGGPCGPGPRGRHGRWRTRPGGCAGARRWCTGGREYRSHKPPQPHKPAPFQPRLAPVTGSPQR
jgi:hypothetical protein